MAWTGAGKKLVDLLRGQPALQERLRALIEHHASGASFLDVGCMWKVHGAYAFHALAKGAVQVTGLDVMPATPQFDAENTAHGGRIRFIQGDVNDPAIPESLGRVDVVFCSGVLYHVPNPLFTLEQLRRLCSRTLILASATIPEQASPQAAIFLPFLADRARRTFNFATPDPKIGLDTEFVPDGGYANWFWGFTPTCVAAMLRAAGFEVLEAHEYRHAVCLVCRPEVG